MKLSIIIPCYNERQTIASILKLIDAVNLGSVKKEIIIVDDRSNDGTTSILKKYPPKKYKVFYHKKNSGKGAAIRTGLKNVTGDIVLIQDADLEYDPRDYPKLIEPIIKGKAQVVYGSRERNRQNKRHSGWSFYAGGLFLTWLTNLLYGSKLTDEATCYKAFDANLIRKIPLQCQRFEFCPEITAKVLRRGIKIAEVPIAYHPRTTQDGKKIRLRDGIEAIWTLIKYRFTKL